MAGHLDVYQWLTVLQEYLVLGLMGSRDRDEPSGSITDVGGILVGHHHRLDPDATLGVGLGHAAPPSCSTPPGTVGAVDVRGGAPGQPGDRSARPGQQRALRRRRRAHRRQRLRSGRRRRRDDAGWRSNGRGVAMDGGLVPIVPGAVIFDLPVGGWECRPTAEFGYARRRGRADVDVAVGTVGAGVGARAGVLKGGVGTASMTLHEIGGDRRRDRRRQLRRATSSTRPPACRGWRT